MICFHYLILQTLNCFLLFSSLKEYLNPSFSLILVAAVRTDGMFLASAKMQLDLIGRLFSASAQLLDGYSSSNTCINDIICFNLFIGTIIVQYLQLYNFSY